jgi:aspartyl protease family protein
MQKGYAMQELPRTLKILTVYGLVFVVLFLGIQWWMAEQRKPRMVMDAAGQMQIVLSRDRSGHYVWLGTINGKEVEFLVDTGATQTTISKALANELGLTETGSATFNTANGSVRGGLVSATLVLAGGLRFERQRIAVLPMMDQVSLLGMDVLGKLRLEQQGKELRISAAVQ